MFPIRKCAIVPEIKEIEALLGYVKLTQVEVSAEGSGAIVRDTREVSVESCNWKLLYLTYLLYDDENVDVWAQRYREDSAQHMLRMAYDIAEPATLRYRVDFSVQGSDFSDTVTFSLCFRMIKIIHGDTSKLFAVANPASTVALDADGNRLSQYFASHSVTPL